MKTFTYRTFNYRTIMVIAEDKYAALAQARKIAQDWGTLIERRVK